MSDTDFLRKSLLALGGLLVWAAHFALIYAVAAIVCERGWQDRSLCPVRRHPPLRRSGAGARCEAG